MYTGWVCDVVLLLGGDKGNTCFLVFWMHQLAAAISCCFCYYPSPSLPPVFVGTRGHGRRDRVSSPNCSTSLFVWSSRPSWADGHSITRARFQHEHADHDCCGFIPFRWRGELCSSLSTVVVWGRSFYTTEGESRISPPRRHLAPAGVLRCCADAHNMRNRDLRKTRRVAHRVAHLRNPFLGLRNNVRHRQPQATKSRCVFFAAGYYYYYYYFSGKPANNIF